MASTQHRHFSSTHWSVVLAAGDATDERSQRALEKICKSYWYPIYAFVRREGNREEEARDLTQEFFTLLLQKQLVSEADQMRGKFRNFLLKTLKNFLVDQNRRRQAAKRGGKEIHVSIDMEDAEHRYSSEPRQDETPESLYQRKWAKAVLSQVMEILQNDYVKAGQSDRFALFIKYLSGSKGGSTHSQVAEKIGMTEVAFKTAFHRFKLRYLQVLRDEVKKQVLESSEVDDEIKFIMSAL